MTVTGYNAFTGNGGNSSIETAARRAAELDRWHRCSGQGHRADTKSNVRCRRSGTPQTLGPAGRMSASGTHRASPIAWTSPVTTTTIHDQRPHVPAASARPPSAVVLAGPTLAFVGGTGHPRRNVASGCGRPVGPGVDRWTAGGCCRGPSPRTVVSTALQVQLPASPAHHHPRSTRATPPLAACRLRRPSTTVTSTVSRFPEAGRSIRTARWRSPVNRTARPPARASMWRSARSPPTARTTTSSYLKKGDAGR